MVSEFGSKKETQEERITCPVSQYKCSIKGVFKSGKTKQSRYISPWRFANKYKGKDELEKAWTEYIISGAGRLQTSEQRLLYERAVRYFANKPPSREIYVSHSGIEDLDSSGNKPKGTPTEPIVSLEENPCGIVPCAWCGADNHAVYTTEEHEGNLRRTCPLYEFYNAKENSIDLRAETFAAISAYEIGQAQKVMDNFQFQGLGWSMDSKLVDLLRQLVNERCDEERASWTFKREMASLDGKQPILENTDDEDELNTDDAIVCSENIEYV